MTTEKKQFDINEVKQITLVDIEELRKTLGAEADLNDVSSYNSETCTGASGSKTCMCPTW